MSTRCQLGFYESTEQAMDKPTALIYRHCDGYPDGKSGVLAALLPWAEDFQVRRGLSDAEYASARALVALMRQHDALDGVTSYGICGNHGLHGDIDYFYRVDPSGITVFETPIDTMLEQISALSGTHYPITARDARGRG